MFLQEQGVDVNEAVYSVNRPCVNKVCRQAAKSIDPKPAPPSGFRCAGMGNLIKVLTRDIDNNAGNFFLDFENAEPSESERELWDQVNVVLKDGREILEDLQSYDGAGEAIQHPGDEGLQEKSWGAVVPLVGKLKKFNEFSMRLVLLALHVLRLRFADWCARLCCSQRLCGRHNGNLVSGRRFDERTRALILSATLTPGEAAASVSFVFEEASTREEGPRVTRLLLHVTGRDGTAGPTERAHQYSPHPDTPTQHLEQEQAYAKQFAEILHFTLSFDELKMANPAIQNDFSYYCRTLSRMRIKYDPRVTSLDSEGRPPRISTLALQLLQSHRPASPSGLSPVVAKPGSENCARSSSPLGTAHVHDSMPDPGYKRCPVGGGGWSCVRSVAPGDPAEDENEVNNEMANRMSLFYAEATPMLKTLSDATLKFVSENSDSPLENTTDCLSTMASECTVMLETPEYRSRFASEETASFCLRVMVGVIILYDYVHPAGAFVKSSKIDMKGCIKVLRDQPPSSVEGLLNALRYTTKHLNDESTSKQIKSMLQ
ncbi:hypothetical protein GJAV_G00092290 [Gymnothorax javanicus]|nr:hypothetical protein GJAV_G00092290 [Gymnothorax javanicus]